MFKGEQDCPITNVFTPLLKGQCKRRGTLGDGLVVSPVPMTAGPMPKMNRGGRRTEGNIRIVPTGTLPLPSSLSQLVMVNLGPGRGKPNDE